MRKLLLLLTMAAVIMFSTNSYAKLYSGLWIECEGTENTLSSKEKIDRLLSDAKNMGNNILFIQVHRGNRAWVDSSYADSSPYNKFMDKYGFDAVQYIIKNGKANGMEVHLWVNTYRILKNKNVPIVASLGEKIFTRDAKKRSILNYPAEDLPDDSYWVDPGDLQVQDYLVKLVKEITQKYPTADGIHMDFVRYPYRIPFYPGSPLASGYTFGYGVDSVNRFMKKTGLDPFKKNLSRKEQQLWDDWRRDQVTSLIKKLNPVCHGANMALSAAVVCWADRAYLSAYQDWRGWLDDGIVDFVATMNYSIDTKFTRYLSREAIASKSRSKVLVGLGAYLLNDKPAEFAKQIDDAVGLGADGIVVFSYDSIRSSGRFGEFRNIIKSNIRR